MKEAERKSFEKNIWKYYLISILNGFWFIIAIETLYYLSFGLNFTQIATIALVYTIVNLALEVPSGAFSDFLGRKLTTTLGYLASTIAVLIIALGSSFPFFLLGYGVWAIGGSLLSGNLSALLFDSLKKAKQEKKYLKIKGRILLFEAITIFVASIVGAYLYQINVRFPWLLFATFLGVATLITLLLKEPHISKKKYDLSSQYKHMKDQLKFSFTHKKVRWLILLSTVLVLPMGVLVELIRQPYLIEIGYNILSLGLIIGTIHGISGLFASFADKIEKRIGELYSFILITLTYMIMFLLSGLILQKIAVIFIVFLFMARDYHRVLIDNYLNHHVRSEQRATVLSIYSFVSSAAFGIFALTIGLFMDILPLSTILIGLSGFVLIFGVPLLFREYSKSEIQPEKN